MNILIWVVQVLLALHTLIGAGWKLSHPAQTVPSLQAIPAAAWLALSIVEILCAVALVIPAFAKSLAYLAPVAAIIIAIEMLLFVVLHLQSGNTANSQMVYWLVVAAVCGFIAYGRLSLRPL